MFCQVPVFFLGEFVEAGLTFRRAGDGFGQARAALRRVIHSGRCTWAVSHVVLEFGAVWSVHICVEIILSYVQPAYRGVLPCCLDLFNRWWWIAPGVVGSWNFHCAVNISVTLSTNHFMGSGT